MHFEQCFPPIFSLAGLHGCPKHARIYLWHLVSLMQMQHQFLWRLGGFQFRPPGCELGVSFPRMTALRGPWRCQEILLLTRFEASGRLETLSWSINSTSPHAQIYLVWLCVRPAFLLKQRHVGPTLVVQKQLLSVHFRSRHLAVLQQSTPYATSGQHAVTQHVHRVSRPFSSLGHTRLYLHAPPKWQQQIKTNCDLLVKSMLVPGNKEQKKVQH